MKGEGFVRGPQGLWPDGVRERRELAEQALGILRQCPVLEPWQLDFAEHLATRVVPCWLGYRWEYAVRSVMAYSLLYYDAPGSPFERWGAVEWTATLLLLAVLVAYDVAAWLPIAAIWGEVRGGGYVDNALGFVRDITNPIEKGGE